MTALRERLAQMGEVASAATPGPWHRSIDSSSDEDAKHIATFSPDVAAALVAVADAAARNQEPTSTEAAPDADMVALGTIVGDRDAALSSALDALAAALGVSR